MKQEEKLKVMIVDDHALMRHGLRSSLETEKNLTVIAEAGDGHSAVKTALEFCPDIILMDIQMPDLNGIEATKQILSENNAIQVIALSMFVEQGYVMGMLNAGASGFLLKDCSYQELLDAIHAISDGKRYLSSDVTGIVVDNALNPPDEKDVQNIVTLTKRDIEVLQLIAEGRTSQLIADVLNISKRTVDIHRRNLMEKLNIRSIAGLTKYAIREGITSL